MPPKPRGPQFQVIVPESVGAGVYSNMIGVWHTPHEFTLDFAVIEPGQQSGVVPARVVSRVRVPPTVMFDLLRTINENMTKYEAMFGEIKRVQQKNQTPKGEDVSEDAEDD